MIHHKLSKRDFLKLSATAGTLLVAPAWAQPAPTPPAAPAAR